MQRKIKGIKIFKLDFFKDNRGIFSEIYKIKKIKKKNFVFDCMSISKKNVIRGMHIQVKNPQAKFLTVLKGKIFDVAIDLRKNSKTFGKYFSIYLSKKSYSSIYIPEGFAHGFCTLAKENIIYYKNSNYRDKKNEIGIIWNDSDIKIRWPIKKPILSLKDKKNISFKEYCKFY